MNFRNMMTKRAFDWSSSRFFLIFEAVTAMKAIPKIGGRIGVHLSNFFFKNGFLFFIKFEFFFCFPLVR
jgi:hypothetical protein